MLYYCKYVYNMVLYIIIYIIMIVSYPILDPIFVVYGTEIIIGETLAKYTLKTIMIYCLRIDE